MQLDKAIKKRKSVRKFSNKKPDWRDIIECINSMRYAPMVGNNLILKAIMIDDSEKIKKISQAAEQDFISETKYLVVVCSNSARIENTYGKRSKIYSRQQAGAAIQNFLLNIEEKNLSTCWIGHFNENKIKKILKIPSEIDVEAVFPIGYEHVNKEKHKRKSDLNSILYFNKYKNKKMNQKGL
jgi:nitroreductase